ERLARATLDRIRCPAPLRLEPVEWRDAGLRHQWCVLPEVEQLVGEQLRLRFGLDARLVVVANQRRCGAVGLVVPQVFTPELALGETLQPCAAQLRGDRQRRLRRDEGGDAAVERRRR